MPPAAAQEADEIVLSAFKQIDWYAVCPLDIDASFAEIRCLLHSCEDPAAI